MQAHRLLAAAVLSSAVLLSGNGFAMTPGTTASGSFAARLDEAKDALRNERARTFERYQRTEIERYLTQAESLSGQGSHAKAEEFLSFARSMLRLRGVPDQRVSQR